MKAGRAKPERHKRRAIVGILDADGYDVAPLQPAGVAAQGSEHSNGRRSSAAASGDSSMPSGLAAATNCSAAWFIVPVSERS